ncbi:hypothetical protein [Marinitenerispora sediminis]|uniref:Uncharacterized protein n=1 Tax=Marinitenerispora sediminis TaxID=1931232 RepID=A0A368T3W0_9ACTN|nr:hypothetical protein [Marinitenerispora sediminis]RCV49753.1 hypothetical protein DEF28_20010 [Marinitenerispora sediminis]RCV53567.1 hypothetical protein DEF23_17360 [Marinitenerispora sediminis]RCV57665.1 hypothetical protein DEF24_14920 [Marinitenerispora sediminis]
MFGFFAITAFGAAYWLDKKIRIKVWGGVIPLLVGLAGSMLLYRSALSQTMVGWANSVVEPMASQFGSMIGEPLPMAAVYGVLCIGGAAVTVMDLIKDHKYNPMAITALIITPVAAHGSAGGWLPGVIDAIHMAGAAMVAGFVGVTVGG